MYTLKPTANAPKIDLKRRFRASKAPFLGANCYPSSHNHGSGKWGPGRCVYFHDSMIMGGRVVSGSITFGTFLLSALRKKAVSPGPAMPFNYHSCHVQRCGGFQDGCGDMKWLKQKQPKGKKGNKGKVFQLFSPNSRMLWGRCTIWISVCSGRAGAVPGRNRVPGTGSGNRRWFHSMGSDRFRGSEGGSRFRWVPTGSWLGFVRFWSSGSWWVFDGVWRFRGFRVSMGSRRFRDQELQKTCGTKFLPSWGWHLCKKGLLNR